MRSWIRSACAGFPASAAKTGARVEAIGIRTLGQLRAAADSQLWPIFGRYTQRVRDRAAGIDERQVHAELEDKSISAEDTFDVDIADPAHLHTELARLADLTCSRMRAKHLVAACIAIKIRRHDFSTFTRQKQHRSGHRRSRQRSQTSQASSWPTGCWKTQEHGCACSAWA